ncbi:MAG: hypothetical protein KC419_14935 [Anaerolineales bacterium]|nr:hypothetical protein [Anaerolineales bacterium]
MKIDVTGQMEINASAEKVWQIVAHEFADIGKSPLLGRTSAQSPFAVKSSYNFFRDYSLPRS